MTTHDNRMIKAKMMRMLVNLVILSNVASKYLHKKKLFKL